ncbi:hypothetical protein GT043_07630 [Streptomyces sp. SID2131]|nr:hypothetical protein [Streptomyces sp. SID2131]
MYGGTTAVADEGRYDTFGAVLLPPRHRTRSGPDEPSRTSSTRCEEGRE